MFGTGSGFRFPIWAHVFGFGARSFGIGVDLFGYGSKRWDWGSRGSGIRADLFARFSNRIGDDLFMLIVCFLILNGFCWIWGRNFGIWFLVPGPCPPWSLDPWSLASGPSAEISNWIVCNPSYFFII